MFKTVSLNGNWKVNEAGKKSSITAKVPGTIHEDLLRAKKIEDPFFGDNERKLSRLERKDWEYRRDFHVSAELLKEESIELVAEGLDTVTTIYINGKEAAKTFNMFLEYRLNVNKYLRPGKNNILIYFHNTVDYTRPFAKRHCTKGWDVSRTTIRKEQCNFGWDWGPRLVTCGIWKDIRLEAFSSNRLENVEIMQEHKKNSVVIKFKPETRRKLNNTESFKYVLLFKGECVAESADPAMEIRNPALWWPAGMGDAALYTVEVYLLNNGTVVDSWCKRIGLRKIELVRDKDRWGESFYFRVNGKNIFAKGANWIPAHAFITAVTRADYERLLEDARKSNMNMIRLWGGGVYEPDVFYDICDEKGLLVWQDFMFACLAYPGDERFLKLVKEEIEFQVKRLRNRACIAIFCGNNEIEQGNYKLFNRKKHRNEAYEHVFYNLIPAICRKLAPIIPYWPSSPHNPEGYLKGFNNPRGGDAHDWITSRNRKPIKSSEENKFRFVSEFGMQSYPSLEAAKTFTKGPLNVFAPDFDRHQKKPGGNSFMLNYIFQRYRFPKDYDGLSYLSWMNQAYAIKTAVTHHRRSMPRTMGSLYWQINDCWPVASWASIEFSGRWKALQYEAKRFFAPALLSSYTPGDEIETGDNVIESTVSSVELWTVYDKPVSCKAVISWTLYHLNGKKIKSAIFPVALKYGEAKRQRVIDLRKEINLYERANLVFRAKLSFGKETLSEDTTFLTAPRYMNLREEKLKPKVRRISKIEYEVTLLAREFHHGVELHLDGVKYKASDNYFDLFFKAEKRIRVTLLKPLSPGRFARLLKVRSIVDAFGK